jgi:hypothetical protein
LSREASVVVVHSVAAGWRLLGRRVQEFHRVDELVVEQLHDGKWSRHPLPPLDEGVVDLSRARVASAVTWHERVLGSPLGTLFVSRRFAGGRLSIVDASTRPPSRPSGVGSDVEWSDVMSARQQGLDVDTPGADVAFRRFWRGPSNETAAIRSLLVGDHHQDLPPSDRVERDRALLDAQRVLGALGQALHLRATWRRLVRRSGE